MHKNLNEQETFYCERCEATFADGPQSESVSMDGALMGDRTRKAGHAVAHATADEVGFDATPMLRRGAIEVSA